MVRKLGLILLLAYLVTGCSLFRPKMPDNLKEQMSRVLQEGATLNAMTEQGVNFSDFGDQLAKTRGAYDLALSMWPEEFAQDAKANFDKAFQGWDLVLYLWNAKINELDNPVEPDINKYQEFVSYSGDKLVLEVHPADFIVDSYRGKKYLPFDENISVLMAVSSDYFQAGQTLIMEEMK